MLSATKSVSPLTVTVPKPSYVSSACIVCAVAVGVTVLSCNETIFSGTSTMTDLRYLPSVGVTVPFSVTVFVSVCIAVIVTVPKPS